MEYSKTQNLQNILYLIRNGLTKKQRQKIHGCNSIFVRPYTIDLANDGILKAILTSEGSCIGIYCRMIFIKRLF